MRSRRVPEGIKRGRLSVDEEAAIVELADEQKLEAGQIALRLNRHPATVSYAMHRLGCRQLTRRTFCYWRAGAVVRSFSPDEDSWMLKRRAAGATTAQIALELGEKFGHPRSPHTVNVRLVLLANVDREAGE